MARPATKIEESALVQIPPSAPAAPPMAAARPPSMLKVEAAGMWSINKNHVSSHGYRTAHPWDAIFADNYFLPIQHWFQEHVRGKQHWSPDEIQIYRKIVVGNPGAETHYYEKCTVVVTYADTQRVTVVPVTGISVYGADVPPSFPPPDEAADSAAKN